jgi:hypothetical protein
VSVKQALKLAGLQRFEGPLLAELGRPRSGINCRLTPKTRRSGGMIGTSENDPERSFALGLKLSSAELVLPPKGRRRSKDR